MFALSDFILDDTKSAFENELLQMQKNKQMLIIDYKEKGGEALYRVQWGAVDALSWKYTWASKAELPLAHDLIAAWHKNPFVIKNPQHA